MHERRPGPSARIMAAVMVRIQSMPPPRAYFGDFARWLPAVVFVGGLAFVLVLLFGAPFGKESGRWLVGAAAVPLWVLRVATLERNEIRAHRFGPAISMLAWWLGGVLIVAAMWTPAGEVGIGLTIAAALVFLFLAHGRYVLVVSS